MKLVAGKLLCSFFIFLVPYVDFYTCDATVTSFNFLNLLLYEIIFSRRCIYGVDEVGHFGFDSGCMQ